MPTPLTQPWSEPYRVYNAALFGRRAELERLLLNWDISCWEMEGAFSALHASCAKGHEGCCAALVAAGAPLSGRDCEGMTPLHVAARGRTAHHAACARRLLDAGADPRVRDAKGRTPLALARGHASEAALEIALRPAPPKRYILIEQPDGEAAFIELAVDDDSLAEATASSSCSFVATQQESPPPPTATAAWSDAIDAFTGVQRTRRPSGSWPS